MDRARPAGGRRRLVRGGRLSLDPEPTRRAGEVAGGPAGAARAARLRGRTGGVTRPIRVLRALGAGPQFVSARVFESAFARALLPDVEVRHVQAPDWLDAVF